MPGQLVSHIRRMQVVEHLFANCIASVRERCNSAWIVLTQWRRHSHSRRLLRSFGGRQLAEIAIDRTQAEAEAAKWFWQP
jgi:uncharacterized protein YjiS (DUF1127 family)